MILQVKFNTLRLATMSMLVLAAAVAMPAQAVTGASPVPPAPADAYAVPTSKTRFNRYVNDMFGPTALVKNAAIAGFSTWRNSPDEWGQTWRGAAKRFGSRVAKDVIRGSVTYGLDESFKLDSHFYKSSDRSTGAKIRNALISPVTARNRNGKRIFGVPRVVGTYTSSIVAAEWWYPARYDWKDGVRSGTISLGMTAGFNLIREFIRK